jgi:hypothetical protein
MLFAPPLGCSLLIDGAVSGKPAETSAGGALGAGGTSAASTGARSSSGETPSSSSSASASSASSSGNALCPPTQSISTNQVITSTGTTEGAADPFTATPSLGNCQAGDVYGAQVVYSITPSADGTLTAALDANFGLAIVEIRSACANEAANVIGCAGEASAGTVTAAASVRADATYYVVAGSFSGTAGTFALSVSLE